MHESDKLPFFSEGVFLHNFLRKSAASLELYSDIYGHEYRCIRIQVKSHYESAF